MTRKGLFNGRIQEIKKGRISDIKKTYNIAYDPHFEPNSDLMVCEDGTHHKVIERLSNLDFIGKCDGIVIGIAGCDPPEIFPENVSPENKESIKRFTDPETNKLTYFHRMLKIKEALLAENIPIEEFDIIPSYPSHLYPSAAGLFEPEDGFAFQYLGVLTDHHFERFKRNDFIWIYDDYREISKEKEQKRNEEIEHLPIAESIDKKPFYVCIDSFIPVGEKYNAELEKTLDKMLSDSERKDTDAVLAILCCPRQKDRDDFAEWKGKDYEEMFPLTPYEAYMHLKGYLLQKGTTTTIDLRRTHITFMPPDMIMNTTPSRSKSYIPKNMKIYNI